MDIKVLVDRIKNNTDDPIPEEDILSLLTQLPYEACKNSIIVHSNKYATANLIKISARLVELGMLVIAEDILLDVMHRIHSERLRKLEEKAGG
jgi:hypothetical protein